VTRNESIGALRTRSSRHHEPRQSLNSHRFAGELEDTSSPGGEEAVQLRTGEAAELSGVATQQALAGEPDDGACI